MAHVAEQGGVHRPPCRLSGAAVDRVAWPEDRRLKNEVVACFHERYSAAVSTLEIPLPPGTTYAIHRDRDARTGHHGIGLYRRDLLARGVEHDDPVRGIERLGH